MKCHICGNETDFIVFTQEKHNCKYDLKRNFYLLTESKTLAIQYFCDSEQCKNNNVEVK